MLADLVDTYCDKYFVLPVFGLSHLLTHFAVSGYRSTSRIGGAGMFVPPAPIGSWSAGNDQGPLPKDVQTNPGWPVYASTVSLDCTSAAQSQRIIRPSHHVLQKSNCCCRFRGGVSVPNLNLVHSSLFTLSQNIWGWQQESNSFGEFIDCCATSFWKRPCIQSSLPYIIRALGLQFSSELFHHVESANGHRQQHRPCKR